jgi:hypothetical protein
MFTAKRLSPILGVALLLLFSAAAAQGDTLSLGPYSFDNFTLTLTNSDGQMVPLPPPSFIVLTGGNNGSGTFGETLFSIVAPTTTSLTFDWFYTTYDCCGSYWDPAGYVINGVKTQLSTDVQGSQGDGNANGETTVNLNIGDTFGFYVDTLDNVQGVATLTIIPVVTPEPSAFALLAMGLIALGALSLRRAGLA